MTTKYGRARWPWSDLKVWEYSMATGHNTGGIGLIPRCLNCEYNARQLQGRRYIHIMNTVRYPVEKLAGLFREQKVATVRVFRHRRLCFSYGSLGHTRRL
jgi:hypothetical protein